MYTVYALDCIALDVIKFLEQNLAVAVCQLLQRDVTLLHLGKKILISWEVSFSIPKLDIMMNCHDVS